MRALLASLALVSCSARVDDSAAAPDVTACEIDDDTIGARVTCANGISFYVLHDDAGGWSHAGCFWLKGVIP